MINIGETVPHRRAGFKLSNSQFAVVAQGFYDRKIEFIAAGNVYYYAPRGIDLAIESGGKGGNLSRSFHDQQELKPANR